MWISELNTLAYITSSQQTAVYTEWLLDRQKVLRIDTGLTARCHSRVSGLVGKLAVREDERSRETGAHPSCIFLNVMVSIIQWTFITIQ